MTTTPSQQAEPTDEFSQSEYADTLNALVAMQESMIYAARRPVLNAAERIIVDLEAKLRATQAAAVAQPTEAQIIRFMNELHSNVPEADRPMSMSDFSEDQIARIRRAFATIVAAPVAQPSAEPVAALMRSRYVRTPGHLAHDSQDHFSEWGGWLPTTYEHAKAVTDPARNSDPKLYEMRPLYAAPAGAGEPGWRVVKMHGGRDALMSPGGDRFYFIADIDEIESERRAGEPTEPSRCHVCFGNRTDEEGARCDVCDGTGYAAGAGEQPSEAPE